MSQAVLSVKRGYVDKFYYHNKKNKLSSVIIELSMIDRFKSRHAPKIIKRYNNGYRMKRYDYALGTTKKLRRTCPNFLNELNEIESDLINNGINHRDINPGNLLYCEDEKSLILIDFYWAVPINVEMKRIGKLNAYYGYDRKAFKKIRKEYGKNFTKTC